MSIMGVLAYLFGWLGGLIVYFISKDDRVARFHGMQSVLFNVIYGAIYGLLAAAIMVGGIVVGMMDANIGPLVMLLATALVGIVGFVMILLALWCMWQAFNDKMYKLPLIGGLAEKWSA